MNWYKLAKNNQILYHISNNKFDKFDLSQTAQGIIWFAKNKEDLLDNVVGANISSNKPRYIYECNVNMGKIAGWNEYDKYYIQQLKDMKYDSIELDDTIAVLNPDIITIIKREIL